MRQARQWVGDNAVDTSKDAERSFVIWGTGPNVPEEMAFAGAGNDIADAIARGHDQTWAVRARGDRWCVIVHGNEQDIDALAVDLPSVSGYAAYLAEGADEEMPREPLRGVLRSDVAPRRKVDQRRPS